MATAGIRLLLVLLPSYSILSRVTCLPTNNIYSVGIPLENIPDSSSARPLCATRTLAKRMEITPAEEVRPKISLDTIYSEEESPSSSTPNSKQDLTLSRTWDDKQASTSSSTLQALLAAFPSPGDLKPHQKWMLDHPELSIDEKVPFEFNTVRRNFLEAFQRFYFANLRISERQYSFSSVYDTIRSDPIYNNNQKTLEELLEIQPRLSEHDRALQRFEDRFFDWFEDQMGISLSRPESFFQIAWEKLSCIIPNGKTQEERKADQILGRRTKLLNLIYQDSHPDFTDRKLKPLTEKWTVYRPLLSLGLREKSKRETLWQRIGEKFKPKASSDIDEKELKKSMFEHIEFGATEFRELWEGAKILFLELIAIQKIILDRNPGSFEELQMLSKHFLELADREKIVL